MPVSFQFLDTAPWYKDSGEAMFCYIAFSKADKVALGKEIKNLNQSPDLENPYIEVEISFNEKGDMEEVQLLSYSKTSEDGCPDYDIVGQELREGDKIIGHSLLSDEEFAWLKTDSKRIFDEQSPNWDWDSVGQNF